jgi:hypothetical protein
MSIDSSTPSFSVSHIQNWEKQIGSKENKTRAVSQEAVLPLPNTEKPTLTKKISRTSGLNKRKPQHLSDSRTLEEKNQLIELVQSIISTDHNWEEIAKDLSSRTNVTFTKDECEDKFSKFTKGDIVYNKKWTEENTDNLFYLAGNFWQNISESMNNYYGISISSIKCKKIFCKFFTPAQNIEKESRKSIARPSLNTSTNNSHSKRKISKEDRDAGFSKRKKICVDVAHQYTSSSFEGEEEEIERIDARQESCSTSTTTSLQKNKPQSPTSSTVAKGGTNDLTAKELEIFITLIPNIPRLKEKKWNKIAKALNEATGSNLTPRACSQKFIHFKNGNIASSKVWTPERIDQLFLINDFWQRASNLLEEKTGKRISSEKCRKIFYDYHMKSNTAISIDQDLPEDELTPEEIKKAIKIIRTFNFKPSWKKTAEEFNKKTKSNFSEKACSQRFFKFRTTPKLNSNRSRWTEKKLNDLLIFTQFWESASEAIKNKMNKKVSPSKCKAIFCESSSDNSQSKEISISADTTPPAAFFESSSDNFRPEETSISRDTMRPAARQDTRILGEKILLKVVAKVLKKYNDLPINFWEKITNDLNRQKNSKFKTEDCKGKFFLFISGEIVYTKNWTEKHVNRLFYLANDFWGKVSQKLLKRYKLEISPNNCREIFCKCKKEESEREIKEEATEIKKEVSEIAENQRSIDQRSQNSLVRELDNTVDSDEDFDIDKEIDIEQVIEKYYSQTSHRAVGHDTYSTKTQSQPPFKEANTPASSVEPLRKVVVHEVPTYHVIEDEDEADVDPTFAQTIHQQSPTSEITQNLVLNSEEIKKLIEIFEDLTPKMTKKEWEKIAKDLSGQSNHNFTGLACRGKFRHLRMKMYAFTEIWTEERVILFLHLMKNFWNRVSRKMTKFCKREITPSDAIKCFVKFCQKKNTYEINNDQEDDLNAEEIEIIIKTIKTINSKESSINWDKIASKINEKTFSTFDGGSCKRKFVFYKKGVIRYSKIWTEQRVDLLFLLANNFWESASKAVQKKIKKEISAERCKKIFQDYHLKLEWNTQAKESGDSTSNTSLQGKKRKASAVEESSPSQQVKIITLRKETSRLSNTSTTSSSRELQVSTIEKSREQSSFSKTYSKKPKRDNLTTKN